MNNLSKVRDTSRQALTYLFNYPHDSTGTLYWTDLNHTIKHSMSAHLDDRGIKNKTFLKPRLTEIFMWLIPF